MATAKKILKRPASTLDSVINLPVVTLLKFSDRWPDLHDQTITGALLISPSPPVIAAAGPAEAS